MKIDVEKYPPLLPPFPLPLLFSYQVLSYAGKREGGRVFGFLLLSPFEIKNGKGKEEAGVDTRRGKSILFTSISVESLPANAHTKEKREEGE